MITPLRRPVGRAHKKLTRGKPISQKCVLDVNELRFEQNLALREITKRLKISQTVLERALFHTRDEWNKYKINLSFNKPIKSYEIENTMEET